MNHVELCELMNKLRVEEGNKVIVTDNLLKKIKKEIKTMKSSGLNTDVIFMSVNTKTSKVKRDKLMERIGMEFYK